MMREATRAVLTTVFLCGFFATASAAPTAEYAFDYRKAVMTTLKGHLLAASMIVRGLVDDDGYLVDHATGLANSAAEIHRVFQEGSDVGETEALPAIWEQPDKFKAALQKAADATSNFQRVVASGSDKAAIGAAFRDVGMSCRGCHDDFRVAK